MALPRTAGVREELQRLTQERNLAPDRDAETLAKWIGDGEKGRKPEPSAPELDRRIEELERERDALVRATDTELERKSEFVTKHRRRLVRDSDAHAGKLRERYEQLIDALAETRAELSDARAMSLWAALYPDRAAGVTAPTMIAGGVRRVLERASVTGQTNPEQVFDLLRADAEWLATVVTHEQGKVMGLRRPDAAAWQGTPEAQEASRREQEKARKRYAELWGQPTSEFGLISEG